MRRLPGMASVASEYDGVILDLWGVVHDGVQAYPGAHECLKQLRAAGKRIVMLSNAPRRADPVKRQLLRMGIDESLYDGVMTSGEATYQLLRDRPDAWSASLGQRVFHLGPERDRNVLAGLDIEILDTPSEATFVLNTGPDDITNPTKPELFDPALRVCAERCLPMICANPDLEVIRGGVRVLCAGTFAQRYVAMGGDVRSLGKPDPLIYGPVLHMLAMDKSRVLAVGDALRTDIAGATAAGLDSCWVLGGIHGDHLRENPRQLDAELADAGLAPVACIPHFIW